MERSGGSGGEVRENLWMLREGQGSGGSGSRECIDQKRNGGGSVRLRQKEVLGLAAYVYVCVRVGVRACV